MAPVPLPRHASGWRIWAPLLVTPLLALAAQSLAYALVTPLCASQAGGWLHALLALGLLAALVLTFFAWKEARRLQQAHGPGMPPDTDRHGPHRLFLARAALGCAALSVLALIAMSVPPLFLSPCAA